MQNDQNQWLLTWSCSHTGSGTRALPRGVWTLGSSPECSLVFKSESVAAEHLRLTLLEDQVEVAVLAPKKGTVLNGVPLEGVRRVYAPVNLTLGGVSLTLTRDPSAPEDGPRTMSCGTSTIQRTDFLREQPGLRVAEGGVLAGAVGAGGEFPEETDFPTLAIQIQTEGDADRCLAVEVSYGLGQELARGGMGRIYVAQDPLLEREVAVKVATVSGAEGAEAFDREARVLARLAHPNIVPVYAMGQDSSGRPFYAMKLVRGTTLYSILKRVREGDEQTKKEYPRERLLRIFRKVCDALAFAHSRRFIHRDLKPGNVMIGEFGEVLVMDWGLAMRLRSGARAVVEEEAVSGMRVIEGTPQYMSPEQAMGVVEDLDERSDVYALGAVLYSILTLRPPVEGRDVEEILSKVARGTKTTVNRVLGPASFGEPQPMDRRVPEALRAVTMKAMALRREDRYQTVDDLESDVDAYMSGFATSAEDAGFVRMAWLLMKRNKAVCAILILSLLGAISSGVVLVRSERVARHNEILAREQQARALKQEAIATEKASLAAENERKAREEHQNALRDRAESRNSAAKAQIALTQAAFKNFNPGEMLRALGGVPDDLRRQNWRFWSHVADGADLTVDAQDGKEWIGVSSLYSEEGIFYTLQEDGWIRSLSSKTGVQKNMFQIPAGDLLPGLTHSHGTKCFAVLRRTKPPAVAVNSPPGVGPVAEARVEIYNAKGELIVTSDTPIPYQEPGGRWVFSPSGQFLAYCSQNRGDGHAVRCLDAQTGKQLWLRNGPARSDIHWERNDVILLASSNPLLGLTTLHAGSGGVVGEPQKMAIPLDPRESLVGRTQWLTSPQRDRNYIFSLSGGICRKLIREEAKAAVFPLYKELTDTRAIAFVRSLQLLASLSVVEQDQAWMGLFDHETGDRVFDVPIAMEGLRSSDWKLFAHSYTSALMVMRSRQLKIWNFKPAVPAHGVWRPTWYRSVAFIDQPHGVVTARLDKKNFLFEMGDTRARDKAVVFPPEDPPVVDGRCASSRDGKTLVVWKMATPEDGVLIKFVLENGTLREKSRAAFPMPSADAFANFQLSPSGRYLWTGSLIAEVATGKVAIECERAGLESPKTGKAAEWIGDDRVVELVLVPRDKKGGARGLQYTRSLVEWGLKSGKPKHLFVSERAVSLCPSPDGRSLAEAGEDGRLRILDVVNFRNRLGEDAFQFSTRPLVDVAWHPKLPLLAVLARDLSVTLWNSETGAEVESLGQVPAGAAELEWSPGGETLLSKHKVEGASSFYIYAPAAVTPPKSK